MKKQTLYIVCQLGGWLTLLLVDFAAKAAANVLILEQIIAVLFLYGSGFFVSQFLRKYYQRKLVNRTLGQTILRVIGASFISANAVMAICLPVLLIAKNIYSGVTLPLSMQLYVSNTIWMSIIFLIWSTLYISITRTRENTRLTQDQATMALNLKEAQLVSLQQQLNPHFMFNCINNIRALILEEPAKARDMLAHMAEMLRYNLDTSDKSFVTIREEVRVAQDYMALCSIQFENRLVFVEEIEEACFDEKLPKMTIQLLLENAIKHGINDAVEGGTITLAIKAENGHVRIKVANTGQLTQNHSENDTGIGIRNIETRLAMAYDKQASFTLEQVEHEVVATLQIPASN